MTKTLKRTIPFFTVVLPNGKIRRFKTGADAFAFMAINGGAFNTPCRVFDCLPA